MDIGDALGDCIGEQTVDELDDRRVFDFGLKRRHALFFLIVLHELEVFLEEVTQKVVHLFIGCAVVLRQVVPKRVLADDHGDDVVTCLEAEDVDRLHLGGVRHGNRQRSPHPPQRKHQMLVGHIAVNELEDLLLDDDLFEVHGRQAVLLGEHPRKLVLRHETQLHQGVPDASAPFLGVV